MKLLLIVANFIPEIGSAAHIYHDLGVDLVRRGHDVHVITSYPREFYLDAKDKNKTWKMDEDIDGIHVHRCKFRLAMRDNIVVRGMEHFTLPRLYFKRYKKLRIKFDGALIYIPPLPLYKMGIWIKKRDGTRSIFNYQDIHPQELVDVGVMKNKLLIKFMEKEERRSYKAADWITVMSPTGVDLIKGRGGDPSRLECIYNSINPSDFQKNLVRKDYKQVAGLEGRFLISYAGILSPFQGIDAILDVAKRFKNDKEVFFLIAGDGMERERLEKRARDEKMDNVRILPLQPRDVYFNIINSSDLSIVSLDSRMTAPCLPGKFINLLGASQAIIANVPEVNDVHWIVKKYNAGIPVIPGDIDSFENAIRSLKVNRKKIIEMGANGRKFLEENMNLDKNVKRYEEIFIASKLS
jgi:glycosyltransferase involved in cell wall biosynthesis